MSKSKSENAWRAFPIANCTCLCSRLADFVGFWMKIDVFVRFSLVFGAFLIAIGRPRFDPTITVELPLGADSGDFGDTPLAH